MFPEETRETPIATINGIGFQPSDGETAQTWEPARLRGHNGIVALATAYNGAYPLKRVRMQSIDSTETFEKLVEGLIGKEAPPLPDHQAFLHGAFAVLRETAKRMGYKFGEDFGWRLTIIALARFLPDETRAKVEKLLNWLPLSADAGKTASRRASVRQWLYQAIYILAEAYIETGQANADLESLYTTETFRALVEALVL
jgi:hypothetical protein